ncbi:carboxypeptidase-like regulatory domain-containing protein [Sphingobacterium siyangense]|jgi:hypothetical protein|uniref:carboxypeptidase-like regulatory domain-containing protein n=1 Tax=Sphingobacterium siyangense TaxID=459529 RepID=UPI003DA2AE77
MYAKLKYIPIAAIALSGVNMNRLYAQQRAIQGKVVDAKTGHLLPGVNVRISGQNQGTLTNSKGEFTINVTGDVLLYWNFPL